jgi:hypothetical protein
VSYDTIYCIEYSYLVLNTIYFARSKFCRSEDGAVISTLLVVLLLPLSLAIDNGEFNNGSGGGGGSGPVAAAAAVAAAVAAAAASVNERDGIQWWWWWRHLMAAALVATFNGGSIGGRQGSGEIQTQQSNQGDVGSGGQHWVLAFNGDNW